MKDLNHKDVLVRSLKTFTEAALAAWAVSGNKLSKDVVLAAVAAGLAAVWNYGKQLSK